MLKRRVSDPIEIVCLSDSALDSVPEDRIEKYQHTRDIRDLHLDESTDKPTIFTAYPLRPEHEHMCADIDPGSLWEIFRHHVCDIKNFDLGGANIWEYGSGRQKIKADARSVFPPEAVQEIALVIQYAASRFDSRPFFSLDTWRRDRARRRVMAATAALTESVR